MIRSGKEVGARLQELGRRRKRKWRWIKMVERWMKVEEEEEEHRPAKLLSTRDRGNTRWILPSLAPGGVRR